MNRFFLGLRRLHLLNVRFLKTRIFIALLLFLPLSALLLNLSSRSESLGIKAGYVLPSKADEYTRSAAEDAFLQTELVKFSQYPSSEELEEALEKDKISLAFVFPESLGESFVEFEKGKRVKNSIQIITKKNTVLSRLMAELVFARLFSRISPVLTKGYMKRTDAASFKDAEDGKAFDSMYKRNRPTAPVFFVDYAESAGERGKDLPLLASPVRGLSAVFLLLVGFAAAFYYLRDKKEGLFIWFSSLSRIFLPLLYIFVAVFDAALVMLFSLYLSGTAASLQKEVILLLFYAISCASFSAFFCLLLGDEALLAGFVPLVLLLSFIICPVFISIKAPSFLQRLFPTYLYLTAVHHPAGIKDLLRYTLGSMAFCLTASFLRNRFSVTV